MTVPEIKEKLTELGVEFDDKLNKPELLELLEKEQSKVTNESEVDSEGSEESVEEELQKPKQYVVIHDFKDLKDNDTIYIKDDIYPRRAGAIVDEARVKELMSSYNKIGKPLIKEQD
ncbi:HeH/LEM domain-containing protein [Paucisalibacillus globulus]|uniref:HeH/LEM domain-containing protein n=1 Tax=Paucisalibacillus globulus TaxID=351095 RepID=UPI000BB73EFD|nr:HeH/LEM domain-containing protein [Paucisalibacillus globulus]